MKSNTDPYGKPQSEEIAKLRHMCRTNLKFLCKEMLGMDKWDDKLHDDMQDFLSQSGSHKLILIPRGHLKSSIVTVGWTIQQILINPNEAVLIRNAVWDLSRDFLKQISGYLTSEPLISIFGTFCQTDSIWTKDVIQIAQRKNNVTREATITTAGLDTALTGHHFSIILDDDLVGQQNVTTKEQAQKVINTYNDSENLLNSGGIHIVIGTRWANRDLYGHILTTDTRSVNMLPVKKEEGPEGWRNVYNLSVLRRK